MSPAGLLLLLATVDPITVHANPVAGMEIHNVFLSRGPSARLRESFVASFMQNQILAEPVIRRR